MNKRATDILELLRQSADYVSGEVLCQSFGITRGGVWKYVKALREAGYDISSIPNRGYRLDGSPNVANEAEVYRFLQTQTFGREILYREETVSTNADALELAVGGSAEGTLVIAEAQRGGRGRMDRGWFSPAGRNLYLSLVLRPEVPPFQVPQLSLVAALALVRAVKDCCPGIEPQIKWPNDVLVGERKLAGILCTMHGEFDRVEHVVLGMGINLNVSRDEFPEDLREIATSLRECGAGEIHRPRFCALLMKELESLYQDWQRDGLEGIRKEWDCYALLTNRRVRAIGLRQEQEGVARGLSPDGGLRLELENGKEVVLHSGDVHLAGWRQN